MVKCQPIRVNTWDNKKKEMNSAFTQVIWTALYTNNNKEGFMAFISVFILRSPRNSSFMLKQPRRWINEFTNMGRKINQEYRIRRRIFFFFSSGSDLCRSESNSLLKPEAKSKFNQVAQRLIQLGFKDLLGWSCGSPVCGQPPFPERCPTDSFSTCCSPGFPNPFLQGSPPSHSPAFTSPRCETLSLCWTLWGSQCEEKITLLCKR